MLDWQWHISDIGILSCAEINCRDCNNYSERYTLDTEPWNGRVHTWNGRVHTWTQIWTAMTQHMRAGGAQ